MTSRATRDEAARQQGLLAAIGHRHAAAGDTGIAEQGERASLGLQIYRANAGALAERALGAAFPTVHALIGPDNFKQMGGWSGGLARRARPADAMAVSGGLRAA
jgi:Putative DNA-binding domain